MINASQAFELEDLFNTMAGFKFRSSSFSPGGGGERDEEGEGKETGSQGILPQWDGGTDRRMNGQMDQLLVMCA